ncbi:hypothetical protein OROGR_023731 [Orobanche gracilis]
MSMMTLECGSDSVLGKRKCESEFGEEEEATGDEKEKEEEAEEEEVATDDEIEKDVQACMICSGYGHKHRRCPWRVLVPPGTSPLVGINWLIACRRCGDYHFNSDELKTCASCGCSVKRVSMKVCPYCWKNDHVKEDCQFSKFGNDYDPFDPPPGIVPVI